MAKTINRPFFLFYTRRNPLRKQKLEHRIGKDILEKSKRNNLDQPAGFGGVLRERKSVWNDSGYSDFMASCKIAQAWK